MDLSARAGGARARAQRHPVHDPARRLQGAALPLHRAARPAGRRAHHRPRPRRLHRHGGLLRQPGGAAQQPARQPLVRRPPRPGPRPRPRRLRAPGLPVSGAGGGAAAGARSQPLAAVPGDVRAAEGAADQGAGPHPLRPQRGGRAAHRRRPAAGLDAGGGAHRAVRPHADHGGERGGPGRRLQLQLRPLRRRDGRAHGAALREPARRPRRGPRNAGSPTCRCSPRPSATGCWSPGTTPARTTRRRR